MIYNIISIKLTERMRQKKCRRQVIKMDNFMYNTPAENTQQNISGVPPINPQNPFENFTEYEDYNSDYSEIVPQIAIPGCQIPFEPSKSERSRIRHFFNITGLVILFHFLLTYIFAIGFDLLFRYITMNVDGVSGADATPQYLRGLDIFFGNSSVSIGLTLLTFMICNLLAFFVGSKITKIKLSSYFKTTALTFKTIMIYCMISFFIRYAGGFAGVIFQIFTGADMTGADVILGYTDPKSIIITVLYTCIVAPVTEELMYRGFVLKNLSRVSQRFGIIMSSLLFGLMHGNMSQFIFAFIMGIFLAHIDIKHNSIVPSIIVHAFSNIVSIAISYSGVLDNLALAAVCSLILISLAILGFIMWIFFMKKNRLPFTMPHQKLRNGTAISSVLLLIPIVVYTFITLLSSFPNLSLDALTG